jgi:hypothetical protein
MSEWRPIETAPRNGDDVLLYRRDEWGDRDILVGWLGSDDLWRYNAPLNDPEAEITPRPTHWQPLPEPPA